MRNFHFVPRKSGEEPEIIRIIVEFGGLRTSKW